LTSSLVILGAGGHAAVLLDTLLEASNKIEAIVSPNPAANGQIFEGLSVYDTDDYILNSKVSDFKLINGVGSIPGSHTRVNLYRKFRALGFEFERVISPTATISSYAVLGVGVQVMQGAIIQAGAIIGENTIVNTGAIVEHDCVIGSHNHIAPGVVLSGQVTTGDEVHIGTGACVIQCVSIGSGSVVGAGAAVTKDLQANVIAYGPKTTVVNPMDK